MAKKEYANKWKKYHEYLIGKETANKYREEIQRICGFSYATFYAKLKQPESLSISEKRSIAEVYMLPDTLLFPELETETA